MRPLMASELHYRYLFDKAQDGILFLNAATGMIEDVNQYLIKMLGFTSEELKAKKFWELGAFRNVKASKDAFETLREDEYIRFDNLPLKTKINTATWSIKALTQCSLSACPANY